MKKLLFEEYCFYLKFLNKKKKENNLKHSHFVGFAQ